MLNILRITLLVTFASLALNVSAQKQIIRGFVSDIKTQKPLKNVHVIILGTVKGATSNEAGAFELILNSVNGQDLVISHIGYKTQQVKVTTSGELSIGLEPEVTDLRSINLVLYPKKLPDWELIRKIEARLGHSKPQEEFNIVESGAIYPNGMEAFQIELGNALLPEFPQDWKSNLTIRFTVDPSGTATDIFSTDSALIKPARMREIFSKLSTWTPATQQQIKVPQQFSVDVIRQEVPEFEMRDHWGMYRFIEKNLRYPPGAAKAGIRGIVDFTLHLNDDGTIMEVKILRDIGEGCGAEVERVVSSIPPEHTIHLLSKTGFKSFEMPVYFYLGGPKPGAFSMILAGDEDTLILPGVSVIR